MLKSLQDHQGVRLPAEVLVEPPVEPQEERISRQALEQEQRPAATKRGGEEVDGPGSLKRTALNPTTGTKRAAETSLDVLDLRSPGPRGTA